MANRYWVGNSGNVVWSSTNTTNWSTTSGGSGGASVPTSADDVFFDTNSGTGTVIGITGSSICRNLTVTATQDLRLGSGGSFITVHGSLSVIPSGAFTFTPFNGGIEFAGTSGSKTISFGGKSIGQLKFNGAGSTWTLQDTVNQVYSTDAAGIELIAGSLNTNNQEINCKTFVSSGTGVRSLTLGSSIITMSPFPSADYTTVVNCNVSTNFTLNSGTSTIIVNNTNATVTVYGGNGLVWNDITIGYSAFGDARTFYNTSTFRNITIAASPNNYTNLVRFANNTVITGALATTGTASGKRIQFESTTGGTQISLTIGSIGLTQYTNFKDINAVNPIKAPLGSTDLGNNTGITFTSYRYWVGGTGTWDASNTANWSTTSGGAGGASVPTAFNDAVFNGSSGSGTVTINAIVTCASINTTGSSLSFASGSAPFVAGLAGKFFNGDWRATISTGNIGTLPLTTTNDSSNVTGTTGLPSAAHRYGVNLWTSINYTSLGDTYGFIAVGYFTPPTSGTYTFYTSSDDGSGVWIGTTASDASGRTTANAVVNNGLGGGQGNTKRGGTITLTGGTVYAIRIVHEEGSGGDNLTFSWAGPGIAETTDLSQYFKTPGVSSSSLTGNYVANASGAVITSSGDVTLSATTTWDSALVLSLSGSSTITQNSVALGPVIINGTNITAELSSNLTAGVIDLTKGFLNLGSYTLTTSGVTTNSVNSRVINFGTGNITVNSSSGWLSAPTGFSYTGTPTVNISNNSASATSVITGALLETQALDFNITTGTYTLTDTSSVYRNLNFTGFSGTLEALARTIYGNLTLSSGMTVAGNTSATTFAKSSGTQTITSNGKTFDGAVVMSGAGTVQFADAFTQGTTRTFTVTAGTLDINAKTHTLGIVPTTGVPTFFINGTLNVYNLNQTGGTVTLPFVSPYLVTAANYTLTSGTFDLNNSTPTFGAFSSSNSNVRSLVFGTGNITLNGSGTVWDTSNNINLTITGTPVVNVSNNSATATSVLTGYLSESTALSVNYTTGTYTLTDTGSYYKNLNFTGFSGTLANSTRTVYGNLTMSSTMTTAAGTAVTSFSATTGTQTITSNNTSLNFNVSVVPAAGIGTTTSAFEGLPGLAGKFFNGSSWRSVGVPTGDVGTLPLTTTNDSSNVTGTTGLPSAAHRYGVNLWPSIYFGTDLGSNYGGIWIGYFTPPTTGTYTFTVNSDDNSALWIGDLAALSAGAGRSTTNALIAPSNGNRSGSISLTAGTSYAFRLVFEEQGGQDYVYFTWSGPGIASTTDLTQYFKAPSASSVLTGDFLYPNVTAQVQPADALTLGSTNTLAVNIGTFTANNQTISTGAFASASGLTRTVTMGSQTWTLSGTGSVWNVSSPNLTFNKNTANILLSNNTTTARSFAGGGLTYNKLTVGGQTGNSVTTITGNNTFSELASDKTVEYTIELAAGSNTSVTTWSAAGYTGTYLNLRSTSTTFALLTKLGAGTLPMVNTRISYVTPVPANVAVLTNSTVVGGSTLNWTVGSNYLDNQTDLFSKYVTKSYLMDWYPDLIPALQNGQLSLSGYNNAGQLGDNTLTSKTVPVLLAGAWKQIDAGGNTSAGIKTDGTLWTWGYGGFGQLGDGSTTTKSSPVTTAGGGTNWKQVSMGTFSAGGVKTDGTLWTWGYGIAVGDGTTSARNSPVTTAGGGTNWKQISCGYSFTAAVKTDGTLWMWGDNLKGQLGTGTTSAYSSPVTTAGGGTNWKQAVVGNTFTAAIKTDGTLWAWGRNNEGQIGDNTIVDKSSPVTTIAGGNDWTQVQTHQSNGANYVAATKVDGSLWTWGQNGSGVLGTNTSSSRRSPGTVAGGGTNWKQISCGGNHMAAIKTDGTLWMWGANSYGAFGAGNTSGYSSPFLISQNTSWKQVSCGNDHTGFIVDSSI